MSQPDLTVITIATGKYFQFFLNLLPSLYQNIQVKNLQIICLTDIKLETKVLNRDGISISFFYIPAYKWPEITLLRYQEIIKNKSEIQGKHLLWIDSDMKVIKDFNPLVVFHSKNVFLAKHPGYIFSIYYFLKVESGIKFSIAKRFLRAWLKGQRNVGAWESNENSKAFVPALKRQVYVHGAVWGGRTDSVLNMCEMLAHRTKLDLEVNYIADWHDESHLNWYSANHHVSYFNKNFSYWEGSFMSNKEKATVLSLDKNNFKTKPLSNLELEQKLLMIFREFQDSLYRKNQITRWP
jgi:hypothetical protein